MKKLNRDFYSRDTEKVAKDLLGNIFVRRINSTVLKGKVVETEAYLGSNDPASHAFNGRTGRNEVMYGQPGRLYVYLCYGMHELMNVVTERKNKPGAVLIRSLEPLKGLEVMKKNRKGKESVTNGPGKLTQSFRVTREHNGCDVTKRKLYFTTSGFNDFDIGKSNRIGVEEDKNTPLRFYVKNNPYVSGQ